MQVGTIYEGQKRFDLKLPCPARTDAGGARRALRQAANNTTVPLSEVAKDRRDGGTDAGANEGLTRTVRVDVNLRAATRLGSARRALASRRRCPCRPGTR